MFQNLTYRCIILLTLCTCIFKTEAQTKTYVFSEPGITRIDSTKGNSLPAFDSLKVLYVFVRFKDGVEPEQGIPEWPVSRVTPPDYSKQWLAKDPANMPAGSLSEYFREASLNKFIYYGDIYPEIITLDSAILWYHGLGGYAAVSEEVIRKMDASGLVDWRKYDNWSKRGRTWVKKGDKMIDHIALILRTTPPAINPTCNWLGSGGGIASLIGGISYVRDSFYVHRGSLMSGLIVNGGGTGAPEETMKTLKHETAHFLTLFHYSATNDHTGGSDLMTHGGWGLASASGSSSICVNSWDREHLGWANFSHEFNPQTDSDAHIILHDFLTKGAALKIKIPYAEQEWYLLEYHANLGKHDRVDGDQSGLYIQHQSGTSGPHHLDIEEADGRYDYALIEQVQTKCCGKHWKLSKNRANALLGSGDRDVLQLDKNDNDFLERTDVVGVPVFMVNTDEDQEIIHYLGDGGDGFIPVPGRNVFGIGSNPSSASNGAKLRSPVSHLNGIKITVLNMDEQTIELSLKMRDFRIPSYVRWTGNIEAHDSIVLAKYGQILLDRSGTFLKMRDTFPVADFRLNEKASLTLEAGSKLVISEKCSVRLDPGAKIILMKNAEILIKRGGILKYNPGQIIFREKKSKITDMNTEVKKD